MKLYEILGGDPRKGDIGVEVECEGVIPEVHTSTWKTVGDGSLRGGYEYVFVRPLTLEDAKKATSKLKSLIYADEYSPEFSFRTSVHVHINCTDMEWKHIQNFIYIYFLLENLLVDFCGEGRKCNRFCLRIEDAEGAIPSLAPLFSRDAPSNGLLRSLANDRLRYASLNVQALQKFGSLEFRAMRGTVDDAVLHPWMETLLNIREFAKQFESPRDVFNHIEVVGFRDFFEKAIGPHHVLFDNGNVEETIARSQSLTIEIPFIRRKKTFVMTEENRNRIYSYAGMEVPLYQIVDAYNGELPENLSEEFLRQDRERANKKKPKKIVVDDYFRVFPNGYVIRDGQDENNQL